MFYIVLKYRSEANMDNSYIWHISRKNLLTDNLHFLFGMHYVVQLLSLVWLSATPWTAAHETSLFITISQSLLKPYVHWVDEATQPSRPLSSPCLQSFRTSGSFPVSHSSHQVAKLLELQLQHQSFQWILRIDFIFMRKTETLFLFEIFYYLKRKGKT